MPTATVTLTADTDLANIVGRDFTCSVMGGMGEPITIRGRFHRLRSVPDGASGPMRDYNSARIPETWFHLPHGTVVRLRD